jgi:hypothetical protein
MFFELPTLHTFLGSPYLAKSLKAVTFLTLVPFILETLITSILLFVQIFSWTITDNASGTVSFIMIILSGFYYFMGSLPYFTVLCVSILHFAYRFLTTIFERRATYLALGSGERYRHGWYTSVLPVSSGSASTSSSLWPAAAPASSPTSHPERDPVPLSWAALLSAKSTKSLRIL